MDNIKKIAVLGGGSFGTVLANIAASNGNNVSLWVRDSEQALRINSEGANSTYHPELQTFIKYSSFRKSRRGYEGFRYYFNRYTQYYF